MRWFGYTHFLLKGLEKVRTGWRFTPKAFGADDAGLQPQTGVEPGELREIDASGGGESAAKRLKRDGRPFFLLLARSSFRTVIRTNRISGKQKPAI